MHTKHCKIQITNDHRSIKLPHTSRILVQHLRTFTQTNQINSLLPQETIRRIIFYFPLCIDKLILNLVFLIHRIVFNILYQTGDSCFKFFTQKQSRNIKVTHVFKVGISLAFL